MRMTQKKIMNASLSSAQSDEDNSSTQESNDNLFAMKL